MALPSLSPFAPCPSCGGWARRPLAPRETRAHCRGCGWRGLLAAPESSAPSRPASARKPPAIPRLDAAERPRARGPSSAAPFPGFPRLPRVPW